jgi:DNA-binding transcriptional MerR regulator
MARTPTTSSDQRNLGTSADAAKVLKVVPDTVRHLARTGRLPVAVRTASGLQLFDLDVVERVASDRRLLAADKTGASARGRRRS